LEVVPVTSYQHNVEYWSTSSAKNVDGQYIYTYGYMHTFVLQYTVQQSGHTPGNGWTHTQTDTNTPKSKDTRSHYGPFGL
jgi:hypothetical protein